MKLVSPPNVPTGRQAVRATLTDVETAGAQTLDADAATDFVDRTYVGAVAVGGFGRWSLWHSRYSGSEFVFDDLHVTGTAEFTARPSAGVLIVQGCTGDTAIVDQHGWTRLPLGEPVLAAAGLSWGIRVTDGRIRLTSVRSSMLVRLADGLHLPLAESPLQFRSGRVTPDLAGVWDRSVDYVASMAVSEVAGTEVVAETCARVLAAAALLCFPRTTAQQMPDRLDADAPEQLLQALAFVAEHAREDVGIAAISNAVHLSPRAVQYLFRKHLDMTPTEYLRRVRLHGAHRDLVAFGPGVTSVGDIAAKWRFGHTGRFAAAYRETFGRSPNFILRR